MQIVTRYPSPLAGEGGAQRRMRGFAAGKALSALIFGIIYACAVFLGNSAIAQETSITQQGKYLATLGDCTSCHTAPGGEPFAGGLAINAPFGTIYGTNITPDPDYGIGTYSLADFARALRHGIAKDGHHLYPAMPYPSFAALTNDDIAALYAYFMHRVTSVHSQPPKTNPVFPFNQRWGIAAWNMVFARQEPFSPKAEHDAAWNRGAYLVQSIGHCGACHTPRNLAYAEKAYSDTSPLFLSGAITDNWFSANLRGDVASGLGSWSEADIAAFLKTGHAQGAAAFGNMTQVVENSMQHMTDADRNALAHYLKSLAAAGENAAYTPDKPKATGGQELPGAGLYLTECAVCHRADGSGKPPRIPALAGNPVIVSADATSLIRIVLEGGKTAGTQDGIAVAIMPAFPKLTDQEIAEVITYIRQGWGNKAPSISARDVAHLRSNLKN